MDKKILFNPKWFRKKAGSRVIKEPNRAKVTDMFGARRDGKEDGELLEKPAVYSLAPGELKKFRTDVANYLLGKFGFLKEVDPEDLDNVLKEIEDKEHKCKLCDFETDTSIALMGHMKSHKISEKAQEIMDKIPEANPDAYVIGARDSGTGQTQFVSPEDAIEQGLGIPKTNGQRTASDKDGVEWYGTGVQSQRRKGMSRVKRGGTPGMQANVEI